MKKYLIGFFIYLLLLSICISCFYAFWITKINQTVETCHTRVINSSCYEYIHNYTLVCIIDKECEQGSYTCYSSDPMQMCSFSPTNKKLIAEIISWMISIIIPGIIVSIAAKESFMLPRSVLKSNQYF